MRKLFLVSIIALLFTACEAPSEPEASEPYQCSGMVGRGIVNTCKGTATGGWSRCKKMITSGAVCKTTKHLGECP